MGANAQTSVPAFTSGQVLTAAQVTQINTGIPVFASSTERDAAFGGTGEKTLAEGQMAYLEDTDVTQYYDGSSWVAVAASGLVFISRTTIGSAVSSVTVSGAFSTDYDNYKIVVSGGTASTSSNLLLTLGSTVTGYYQAGRIVNYAATTSDIHDQNVANWRGGVGGVTLSGDVTIYGPYASDYTGISTLFFGTRGDAYEGYLGGYLADTTSYTAFTLAASSGTITGGSIDVYGYAKA